MVNFGPLAAEIVSLVWGTPANVNDSTGIAEPESVTDQYVNQVDCSI